MDYDSEQWHVETRTPPQETAESVGNSLKPLPPGSSSRDVLDALSGMIELEGLKVGDRLPPEIEIANQLGIGRAKVREALTSWQNMGIVVRNKKAGTRLAAEVSANTIHLPFTLKLEAESLLRTHAVRRPLEIEAARLAALNCSDAQRLLISARVAELIAVHSAGEDWRQADYRFHASLHEACGNPLFGQLIRQIQEAFNEVYEAPFGQPHLGQATIPMHTQLAEAVVAGRAEEAARIVGEIMDMVEAEVLEIMESQNV